MANDRNRSRTAAIKVCLPFNFAVVFDFMYFRFRPSKAKSMGNVITDRQNAANCSSLCVLSCATKERLDTDFLVTRATSKAPFLSLNAEIEFCDLKSESPLKIDLQTFVIVYEV